MKNIIWIIAFVLFILIVIAPDLDTAIIYALIVISIFFLAPINKEIRGKYKGQYIFVLGENKLINLILNTVLDVILTN